MKINSISLSWFRGASDRAILNTDLKNVVVYGSNGSGKSSFSDAIEYIVSRGKIGHLTHEYSGSKQEKGVINTCAPEGYSCSTIRIAFEGDFSVDVEIKPDGTPTFSSNPDDLVEFIQTWELERLILRQDEVASFIQKTKGVKYSVLLPLLGLANLERATENIRGLRRSVEDESKLAKVDALLDSHIEILQEASKYVAKLGEGEKEIKCPACGRMIHTDEFSEHVQSELEGLKDLCSARDLAIEARRTLHDSIRQVLVYAKDDSIANWLNLSKQRELKEALTELTKLSELEWQGTYSKDDKAILYKVIPIISHHVKTVLDVAPPSNQKLLDDSKVVEVSKNINSIHTLEKRAAMINGIIQALDSSELKIRNSIRSRTNKIIKTISADIQGLWAKIHPNEPIEDVKLYLPEETDKSIDISLKFYGLEQPSPRLTLSEGHRNSLGLCIFLALARLGDNKHRCIFLDDIVSSFDRWHRGNIINLLLEDLSDRQVLLFTHDREWFQELRVFLPTEKWKFLVLKPWRSPSIGLQWSESEDTFDDARTLIDQNCESAGNCVRQIMDTRLAITTEKLRIKMPYARGDRNDHRTCIEFLESIISEAKERLRKEEGGSWHKYPEPIGDWKKAHDLLISFANRASHTGSVVPTEVERLIQACEVAIERFKCSGCGTYFWRADQTSQEIMQCRCGQMQWRYG